MMENGLYPMIMIPPISHHHHHHHSHHNNTNTTTHDNNINNTTTPNNNNNNICSSSSSSVVPAAVSGCYDHHHHNHNHNNNNNNNNNNHHQLMGLENHQTHHHHHHQQHQQQHVSSSSTPTNGSSGSIKAKIMAHPHYPRLLSSFLSCQKVGAPPEVVARLEETEAMVMNHGGGRGGGGGGYVGEDPSLDQFMEAYCEMLTKYEQELTKPFKEAMLFLSRAESQFKTLTISSSPSHSLSSACGEVPERFGSSGEEIDVNNNFIDPSSEDRELKGQLLRRYSGCLGNLRQEFLKKRKKGKLPKEARQQLLDWWSRHYKWPYPSESQKLALAESTGLDQKQINNWFINQRKRHWKPSEDMQFVVMDAAAHSHAHSHYGYMENVLGNPFPMDVSPTLM